MYVSIPREHVWRRSQAISEQQPLRLVYRSLCQNTTASESQQLLQKSETELGDVTYLKMGWPWPVWGRAWQGRPPHKDIVTCVSGACSTSPIPPTPSIPSFDHAKPAMNLDPMLTSCAVKEHDPLDYILLPLPKMSSFMIGVTALL